MKDSSKHIQETAIISLEIEELESRIAPADTGGAAVGRANFDVFTCTKS
jgi:hypothetical protein